MSYLHASRMDLRERLYHHLGKEVALQAQGFASRPGVLSKVGKRFIRVNEGYYVPHVMQEIVLLGAEGRSDANRVLVHPTYTESFYALIVRAGSDFVELRVDRPDEEEELTILIPYNKLIGLSRPSDTTSPYS